jgi:hypothetical protein
VGNNFVVWSPICSQNYILDLIRISNCRQQEYFVALLAKDAHPLGGLLYQVLNYPRIYTLEEGEYYGNNIMPVIRRFCD